jgi:hypothetical protein
VHTFPKKKKKNFTSPTQHRQACAAPSGLEPDSTTQLLPTSSFAAPSPKAIGLKKKKKKKKVLNGFQGKTPNQNSSANKTKVDCSREIFYPIPGRSISIHLKLSSARPAAQPDGQFFNFSPAICRLVHILFKKKKFFFVQVPT